MTFDRLFFSVAVMIFLLSSCDTRDDYFVNHSEAPLMTLYSDHDSTFDGKKYIVVELGWGDTVEVEYFFEDIYLENSNYYNYHRLESECLFNPRADNYYWKIYGSPKSTQESDFGDLTTFSNNLTVDMDLFNQKLVFIEHTRSAEEFYNVKNYSPLGSDSLSFTGRITIKSYNILGNYGTAYVFVKTYANRPPVADFSLEKVPGESSMHRRIVAHCSDPDRDDIIAYEYCIDGKTIGSRSVYDTSNSSSGGQAAYNGTYITRTSLSSVNHVFQESGAHTVSVRCQDKWLNWSAWTSQELIIE